MGLSDPESRDPKACPNDLVGQKIRLLNTWAMFLKEILDKLKKDFVHLGLDKKETKELQAGLNGYIKAGDVILPFLILPSLAY